jgi:hypothetical protein
VTCNVGQSHHHCYFDNAEQQLQHQPQKIAFLAREWPADELGWVLPATMPCLASCSSASIIECISQVLNPHLLAHLHFGYKQVHLPLAVASIG